MEPEKLDFSRATRVAVGIMALGLLLGGALMAAGVALSLRAVSGVESALKNVRWSPPQLLQCRATSPARPAGSGLPVDLRALVLQALHSMPAASAERPDSVKKEREPQIQAVTPAAPPIPSEEVFTLDPNSVDATQISHLAENLSRALNGGESSDPLTQQILRVLPSDQRAMLRQLLKDPQQFQLGLDALTGTLANSIDR